jgi:hypothetical protein
VSELEILTFKIGLSGTYWDRQPQFEVSLDDQVFKQGTISSPSGEIEYHEFSTELSAGDHVLGIRLLNKQPTDTVQSDDKSHIVKDLLLNVESIEIDEVEIAGAKWYDSEFITDQPVEFGGQTVNRLEKCVNLGFNGQYRLKFASPFYIWLLEKL